MDSDISTAHQTTSTIQEDTRMKNMDPEEESAHRSRHASLEWTRLHHLSIQKQRRTRAHPTQ